jgi:hypothetical protein
LAQPIEKPHPVNANFPLKVCKAAATSCVDCLREVASHDERIGQPAEALSNHLTIAEVDGNFNYFI